MNDDTATFRVELASAIDPIFTQIIQQLREHIDERWSNLQRELLRAFADYTESNNIRFCKLEADISHLDKSTNYRLGELERQVTDVEGGLINVKFPR